MNFSQFRVKTCLYTSLYSNLLMFFFSFFILFIHHYIHSDIVSKHTEPRKCIRLNKTNATETVRIGPPFGESGKFWEELRTKKTGTLQKKSVEQS